MSSGGLKVGYKLTNRSYNYYGEILLDRGEFTAALENLDKAIVLEKEKAA